MSKFEKSLLDYTGAKYAILFVNGTVALQTALILAGVKPNHEVLVPNLSFSDREFSRTLWRYLIFWM